ncbi:MAG: dipeptide epimerase [Gammaproteobacteria bacterium]|nr:dipeptide epimerase [Gammaproteobacteria bacterium]
MRVYKETLAAIRPFRIADHVWYDFPCTICEIEQDGYVGRGEAHGVYYLGETPKSMQQQLESVAEQICAGATREQLLEILPPGGARMAADSALWDLQAQLRGVDAWTIAGVKPQPVQTVFTIGLEKTAAEMRAKAVEASRISLFKVKLDNDLPVERMEAIRGARPDAALVVDVNEGWNIDELKEYAPALHKLDVLMIEQPLPRGNDADLEGLDCPVPLCADESCLHLGELEDILPRYQMVNIKLDKAGGLTHGLQLASAARAQGLTLMVGCMSGTSLSMAPSHVIAQLCDFVDIDGPLLIKKDHDGGLIYDDGVVSVPKKRFWGQPIKP